MNYAFTLRENIHTDDLNKDIPTDEEIGHVLKLVNAEYMLTKMADGSDTLIHRIFKSDAYEPSGGEKQKISIARSLFNSSETKVIYFTGDIVYSPKLVKDPPESIDAIFANLGAVKSDSFGGPFTMNLQMMVQLKLTVKSKNICPIHIDDYSHYLTTKQEVETEV